MSAMSLLNRRIKDYQRKRLERRPEELASEGERIRARKNALSQLIAQRNTSNIEHQKGTEPCVTPPRSKMR
jgi:hypothetical protein